MWKLPRSWLRKQRWQRLKMQTRRLLLGLGPLQLALLKLWLLSQRLRPAGQLQRLLQVVVE